MLFSFLLSDPIAQEYLKLSGNENENQGILSGGGRSVPSKRVLELRNRLIKFMENHIYPMENEFYNARRPHTSPMASLSPPSCSFSSRNDIIPATFTLEAYSILLQLNKIYIYEYNIYRHIVIIFLKTRD